MRSVFGIPVGVLAVILSVLVGLGIALIAALAVRNLVFFRLGVRNIRRRAGRSALIVVGLMLATTIIAAALGTGDTMGRSVRSGVLSTLGNSDEWITVKGTTPDVGNAATTGTAAVQLFDQRVIAKVDAAARNSGLVDGVMPAIVRTVAVQDQTSRQTEPRVKLFAPDPARLAGFGTITGSDGRAAQLATLAPGSVFFNRDAADALGARRGDAIAVLVAGKVFPLRIADVVTYRGAGTDTSAMLLPLAHVQRAIGAEGKVDAILISNRGGESSGVARTDAVTRALAPTLDPLGLQAQPLKQDGLKTADKSGSAFMSMFSTFGSFSIAAGILLIFLIFVMLAAERRTEMGVARAIGTQRGHLVQTFLFEGAAYDLIAAAVGALLGVLVSLGMVAGIGHAFSSESISVEYSVRWQSVLIAYTMGVLLTFLVVAFSAWRVSVLNIVTAVRNLPDPARRNRGRRGWLRAAVPLLLGTLLAVNGRASAQTMPFLLGLSLVAIGTVPVLRSLHVSDRVAYTVGGLAIVVVWLLPFRVVESVVPGAQMDFSIWVVGGLLIVLGAVWTVIYNADAFLGATMAVLGRVRSLSAVLKISMAYPLRNRLRTGMTLAMFTLVVFTLVVGITTPSSFIASSNKPQAFGGGFQVRAMTSPASPITDMTAALRTNKNIDARAVRAVASISTIPVKARQAGANKFVDYPLHGFDQGFLDKNRYALGSRARGYTTDTQVWDAIAKGGNLAVVDPWIVPHRRNWSFGALTELTLSGFYAEDPTFDPVPVEVRDPETGHVTRFTVIGVLRDSMPFEMAGISTSQRALGSYGDRARPTTHLFALAPGTDANRFATQLESAFLANGTQADSFAKLVHDSVAGSMVFLRLIEGFMGLGLIVGVAALGVIAARSVVERRQQIGVLRAIGFQASTVRLGFLLESGFLAFTSIVVGSALGLAQAYNVVDDARRQATWPGVHLVVPWLNLAVVFVIVMLVALATTYLPARRASRVYPAEALRYE
jgi:putative ABC transport system permease protein